MRGPILDGIQVQAQLAEAFFLFEGVRPFSKLRLTWNRTTQNNVDKSIDLILVRSDSVSV